MRGVAFAKEGRRAVGAAGVEYANETGPAAVVAGDGFAKWIQRYAGAGFARWWGVEVRGRAVEGVLVVEAWSRASGVGLVVGAEPDALRLFAGCGGFWYSFEVCQFAVGASMAGVCTTGYHRRVLGAETEVRLVRFAFRNINKAGSAGSASIRGVRAGRIGR
jgi:hypothetical protein